MLYRPCQAAEGVPRQPRPPKGKKKSKEETETDNYEEDFEEEGETEKESEESGESSKKEERTCMTQLTNMQQTDNDSNCYDDRLTYVTTNTWTDLQSQMSEFKRGHAAEMLVNKVSSDLEGDNPTTLTNMAASDLTDVTQLTDSDTDSLTLTDVNQSSNTRHTPSYSISSLTDLHKTTQDVLQDHETVSETHTENHTDTTTHTDSYTSFSDSEPEQQSRGKIARVETIDNLHLAENEQNTETHFTTDAEISLEGFNNEPRNDTDCDEQSALFDDDLQGTVDHNPEVIMADRTDNGTNDTLTSPHDSKSDLSAELDYDSSDSSDTIDHALKTYLSQELSETEIESDLESRAGHKEQQSDDLEVVYGQTESSEHLGLDSAVLADVPEQNSDITNNILIEDGPSKQMIDEVDKPAEKTESVQEEVVEEIPPEEVAKASASEAESVPESVELEKAESVKTESVQSEKAESVRSEKPESQEDKAESVHTEKTESEEEKAESVASEKESAKSDSDKSEKAESVKSEKSAEDKDDNTSQKSESVAENTEPEVPKADSEEDKVESVADKSEAGESEKAESEGSEKKDGRGMYDGAESQTSTEKAESEKDEETGGSTKESITEAIAEATKETSHQSEVELSDDDDESDNEDSGKESEKEEESPGKESEAESGQGDSKEADATAEEKDEVQSQPESARSVELTDPLAPLVENKTEADLSGYRLDQEQVDELVSLMEKSDMLSSLVMRNGSVDDANAQKLCDAVKKSPASIKMLNFNLNKVGPEGAASVVDTLRTKPSIEVLLLHGNPLGDEGVTTIADGLISIYDSSKADQSEPATSPQPDQPEPATSEKSDQPEPATSEKSDQPEPAASEKSDQPESAASEQPDQPETAASEKSDQPEDTGADKKEEEEKEPEGGEKEGKKEEEKDENPNEGKVEGSKGKAPYILQQLDLGDCGFGDGGAESLSRLLVHDCGPRVLMLTGNKGISADGWKKIASALKTNTTVKALHLDYCEMTNIEASMLVEGLSENKTLQTVDLEGNNIGFGGGRKLVQMLEKNSSILEMKLHEGNSGMGDGLKEEIQEVLEKRAS
ncbi:hypothetical protein Bbelb_162560 [Branchiostoma belcheri]|nr:hypothetical protein Bbelb_162560 [Branchiostoma belcheri]